MNSQFLQGIRANALGPSAKAHVDLSNNFLRPRDLENFVKAIQKNVAKNPDILCPILSINLCGNEICGVDECDEGEFEYRGLKILSTTLIQRSKQLKLRKLVLSRNRLGKRGFGFVATILAGNHAITDLYLRDCGADEECLEQFVESIEKSKSLTNLDLSFNSLDIGGASVFSKQLRSIKRLKSLDLSSCKLGSYGMRSICDGLAGNMSIQILLVSCNDCGDDGSTAIGNLLKENSSLCHLDLQHNKISSNGMCAIADGLEHNKSVQGLALQWNEIGNHGGEYLAERIRNNTTLKSLFLFANRINDVTAGLIACSPIGAPLELDITTRMTTRRKSVVPVDELAVSPIPGPVEEAFAEEF